MKTMNKRSKRHNHTYALTDEFQIPRSSGTSSEVYQHCVICARSLRTGKRSVCVRRGGQMTTNAGSRLTQAAEDRGTLDRWNSLQKTNLQSGRPLVDVMIIDFKEI
ncbi:jg21086 [Pararge aegeria aegeria]|uniref:Jg21086 protein n=1 Tax=Pararge aegeria aegeria TaxID=348720 RepID=A0A8S4RR30_9NEOP|nr:jg21086 [Pararge aegeria aegeria]